MTILPLLQRLNCILVQVKEADGTKQETDANMEIMFGKLRSAKSIALDALVLNRSSFSQTVENLFSLSFLVKDGRAAVNYASDGTHLIGIHSPSLPMHAGQNQFDSCIWWRVE